MMIDDQRYFTRTKMSSKRKKTSSRFTRKYHSRFQLAHCDPRERFAELQFAPIHPSFEEEKTSRFGKYQSSPKHEPPNKQVTSSVTRAREGDKEQERVTSSSVFTE